MIAALIVLGACLGIFAVVWSIIATIGWLDAVKTAADYRERLQVSERHRLAAAKRKVDHLNTVFNHALEKGHDAGYAEGVAWQKEQTFKEVGNPWRITKIMPPGTLRPGYHERFRHEAIETLLKEGLAIRSEFGWWFDVGMDLGRDLYDPAVMEAYVLTTPLAPAPMHNGRRPYEFEYHTTHLEPR